MDIPAGLLAKLERYCAYQERSEAEVRKKMGTLAVPVAMADEIVKELKACDFLNETRFAETYVRSKLKEKWGKLKIRQGLYQKGIAAEVIQEQMDLIDDDQYMDVVRDTIEKWKRLNSKDADNRPKLIRHMLSKGFAMDDFISLLK
jgi:regulatory protein